MGQVSKVKFSPTQSWHKFEQNGIAVASTEPILAEGLPLRHATISKEERHVLMTKYDGETIVLKIISKAKKVWVEEEGNEYETTITIFIRNKSGSVCTFSTRLDDYILQIAINSVVHSEVMLIGTKGSYRIDLLKAINRKKIEVEKVSEDTVIPVGTRYWLVTNIFRPTWFAIVRKPLLHNIPKTVLYRQLVTSFSHEYYQYAKLVKFSIDGNEIEVTIRYKGEERTEKYTLALF